MKVCVKFNIGSGDAHLAKMSPAEKKKFLLPEGEHEVDAAVGEKLVEWRYADAVVKGVAKEPDVKGVK